MNRVVPIYLARVEEGRVYLCRVASNALWSHAEGDAPYFWVGFPTKSYTPLSTVRLV